MVALMIALSTALAVLPPAHGHHGAPDSCALGVDAGDDWANATEFPFSSACPGGAWNETTVDWYKRTVWRTDELGLTSLDGYASFCVFAPNGTQLFCNAASAFAPEDGEYRLRVAHPTDPNAPAASEYSMYWYRWRNGDCDNAWDAGPDGHGDASLTLPKICGGHFAPPVGDTQDSYRFFGLAGMRVNITVPLNQADMCLYGPAGGDAIGCQLRGTGPASMIHTLDAEGWSRVTMDRTVFDTYTLNISAVMQSDCGLGGDSPANTGGYSIPLPTSCHGFLVPTLNDHADYYKIHPRANARVVVRVNADPTDVVEVCMFWSNTTNACKQSTGGNVTHARVAPSEADWFVQIKAISGDTVYDATFNIESDCGTGQDAGASTALVVALPADCVSDFSTAANDTSDRYGFDVAAGTPVRVENDGEARVCLRDPADVAHGCLDAGPSAVLSTLSDVAGRWTLDATHAQNDVYSFEIETRHDDCALGIDVGNNAASARNVTAPFTCGGTISPTGDAADWFAVSAPRGALVTASVTGASIPVQLCLREPGQVACDPASVAIGSAGGNVNLEVTPTAQGGSYAIALTVAPQNDCGLGADLGNNATDAHRVTLVATCDAILYPVGDETDHLVANATIGALIEANVTPGAASAIACLATDTATSCSSSATSLVSPGGDARLALTRAAGSGAYAFGLRVTPQNDCASGRDAAPSWAVPVTSGAACAGAFPAWLDPEDEYMLHVAAGQRFKTTLSTSPHEQCQIAPSSATLACASGASVIDTLVATAGAHRMRIAREATGAYSALLEALPTDCGIDTDASDTRADATPLAPGAMCGGSVALEVGDANDWYRVSTLLPAALVTNKGPSWLTACTTDLTGGTVCVPIPARGAAVIAARPGPTGWHLQLRADGPSEYAITAA